MNRIFPWLLSATLLFSGGLLTACNDDDNSKPEPVAVGALAGTFSPTSALTAVTVTDATGAAKPATLNAAGRYTLGGLSAGTYTVSYTPAAGYDGPASQTATVVARDTFRLPAVSLRPTAPQTGALAGTFSLANTLTAVTVTDAVGAARPATFNPAGSYVLGGLSAGTYTVSYTPATGYEAPANQTATVVVRDTFRLPAISVRQLVVPSTRATLLTQPTTKRWKLTAATTTFSGQQVDIYSLGVIQDCIKDNLYHFLVSGVAVVDEAALKCNTTDPQTVNGTWQLTNNDANIRIVAAGQTQEGELRSITNTVFTIYNPAYPVPNFGNLPVELTFTAQ